MNEKASAKLRKAEPVKEENLRKQKPVKGKSLKKIKPVKKLREIKP